MFKMQLSFTRDSFDRLAAVAKHMGHHVKSLLYNIDLLQQHFDQVEYEGRIAIKNNLHDYSLQQFALGWEAYNKLWHEQASLRASYYGKSGIATMISQMPNLKHITLSNEFQKRFDGTYFDRAEVKTLPHVSRYGGYNQPSGLPQLLSVVEALHRAG